MASLSLFCFLSIPLSSVQAQSVDELNKRLEDQKAKIDALNKEIQQKQQELLQIGGEKSTLQGTIRTLELARNKLQTDINKTETQIKRAETTLEKLGLEINSLSKQEENAKEAIGSSLRTITSIETESPIEVFLSGGTITDFWVAAEEGHRLNKALEERIVEINTIQGELKEKHTETEKEKNILLSLKKNLSGQKVSVESTKKAKDVLLSQTQSKEAEYQRILQQKIAQKALFEKELFAVENALKIALDPKSFAVAKSGILSWPVDNVRITQYFGATADAKRLYVSGTHNGIDIGVPDGTALKTALSGTVTATGNTDGGGCYSYGKWILIKHENGLSTLYAHLSSIGVSAGDIVSTGEIIGYSGRTGYATGPHLHFTVYATQGVRVQQYSSSINCKNATIPIADPKAYLDPMAYLPAL